MLFFLQNVVDGIAADSVKGVGFDATCSMVVLDAEGKPLTVSPSGNHAQNIIMWMDHRAAVQADRINAMGHEVLEYTGGKISLEMEVPKLLWLKEVKKYMMVLLINGIVIFKFWAYFL